MVVEAALRSGSLITARLAAEQGREVLAVPGSPLDPRCRGTNRLIRDGAALIEAAGTCSRPWPACDTDLRGRSPLSDDRPTPSPCDATNEVDETRRDVLDLLGPSPIAVDELLRQCQSSPPVIGQVLLELDLAGRLERHPGNAFHCWPLPERRFGAPLAAAAGAPKSTLESRKTQMKVVVVEIPAKAKTINKYLGRGYTRAGQLRPCPRPAVQGRLGAAGGRFRHELGGRRPRPEAAQGDRRRGQGRRQADPGDRPGPRGRGDLLAHARGAARPSAALGKDRRSSGSPSTRSPSAPCSTPSHNPREIDQELVDAYLARRALDYLVGFTLSPVLWRKLPGSRSAGRVQSVALRLICEREAEIEAFKPREYWTIEADFTGAGRQPLHRAADPSRRQEARQVRPGRRGGGAGRGGEAMRAGAPFKVAEVERKQVKRHPSPPFTTSTLQQEASRKLGFGASHTMRIAQRLYEGVDIGGETVGLITYMRTDGVHAGAARRSTPAAS